MRHAFLPDSNYLWESEEYYRFHPGPNIEYRQAAMEDLQFADANFDVVLSSLAFHYVADFTSLVQNISHWLKLGRILTVPAITAAQVQNGQTLKIR